jgi:hypothetical protein
MEKIQVILKSDKIFHTEVAEKIKTHISCSITFLRKNRAVYRIVWKNMAERDRPLMTV